MIWWLWMLIALGYGLVALLVLWVGARFRWLTDDEAGQVVVTLLWPLSVPIWGLALVASRVTRSAERARVRAEARATARSVEQAARAESEDEARSREAKRSAFR